MKIKHDKELSLAFGASRKTKTWKNKKMLWSALLDRLSNVTRTSETVAEFRAMSRDLQSDIKDVGGFVGGYLNNGKRTDVRFRSVVCLDADFAEPTLWEDWEIQYGFAAAVYSTHKHTPENPRLRLVVPLLRNVSPEEYQAVSRKLAYDLGIEQFDDTSYQPQRLMYWPSASSDGEYVFHYLDGEWLDPDTVLQTYTDWRDVSAWPMSSRVAEVVKKSSEKQKDPLSKPGLVGAFCRAYSIEEAIEAFVPDYSPCDEPGRYTYTKGSTAAGVVVYDGKFSYSHHATDPASMQLCNAWDLVRLHKFGDMDEDCPPDMSPKARPSYRKMSELATLDERVRAQIVADKVSEAANDFSEPVTSTDWRSKLKVTDKGAIAQTIQNVVIILKHDPKLSGALAYNEMSHNIVTVRDLPWRKLAPNETESQWVDADDAALRYYLEKFYGLGGKEKIFDAVNVVAMQNLFHPVRDYLGELAWDGESRLDTLLVDYLGAEDNEYVRAVTRKALVAAVARVYHPGCKFDYMLVLRGRQGIGKSALVAKLGGSWFSDSFTTLQGKDAYEQVQGVWIMEVGELAGMRKAEAETIKLYISKQVDRFRPAYGRRLQEFPRQCIFIGSTNETQFLRDTTGNRRFWVVDTPNQAEHDLWDELTDDTIGQVWAEAVHYYKQGEKLYLSRKLEIMAREVQESFEEESPRFGLVAEYLDRTLPKDWDDMDLYTRRAWLESGAKGEIERQYVCTLEIWTEALNGNPDKLDRLAITEIKAIMSKMPGWRHQGNKVKVCRPYGRQKYYRKVIQE